MAIDSAAGQFKLTLDRAASKIYLDTARTFNIPDGIDLLDFHQLRIIRLSRRMLCYFNDVLVGEIPDHGDRPLPRVFCDGARVAIEMIRVTRI